MAEPIKDLPGEIWKPVVGWAGLYEVSNMGRVKSLERTVFVPHHSFVGPATKTYKERLRRCGGRGYSLISLQCGPRLENINLHILVLTAFVRAPRPGEVCRHLDGDKRNNTLANLRWGTVAENMADAVRHGTKGKGELAGNAKLTDSQVREIRALAIRGVTSAEIARRYGVARVTISAIRTGRNWSHVA